MYIQKTLIIEVGGRLVRATVTVDAPGLDPAQDYVSPNLLLTAAATEQATLIRSRHHPDRDVRVWPASAPSAQLRLVA